jgi:hypothetical protein
LRRKGSIKGKIALRVRDTLRGKRYPEGKKIP